MKIICPDCKKAAELADDFSFVKCSFCSLDMTYGEYLKLLSDFYTASFRIIKKGGYAIIVFGDYYTAHSGGGSRVQPMRYLHHIIAERAGWTEKTTRIWQKDFATLSDKFSIMTLSLIHI